MIASKIGDEIFFREIENVAFITKIEQISSGKLIVTLDGKMSVRPFVDEINFVAERYDFIAGKLFNTEINGSWRNNTFRVSSIDSREIK
jgi:hypothetical protein